MVVRLVLWNLADSKTSVGELRRHLRSDEATGAVDVAGLRLRAYVSDETTERWGYVELWDSRPAAERQPPTRLRELIGKDPEIGEEFGVEATAEGRFADDLSRRGLAFEE